MNQETLEVDMEVAQRWSEMFCLHPFDAVFCIHNKECSECQANKSGHHEFTDMFPTALPTLKAAYDLKHARGEI